MGDVWVFDNARVLHGRAAFAPTSPRELEGGYFSWDDVESIIRLGGGAAGGVPGERA